MSRDNNRVYSRHISTIQGKLNGVTKITKLQPHEFIAFIGYTTTLIVGKIIHLFSPTEEVFNYFNNKRNIFNTLFVKQGWLWTTLTIVTFYVLHLKRHPNLNRQVIATSAITKYVLITAWWWFFTQWFFGLPVMDRIFVLTGGKCINIPSGILETYMTANPNGNHDFQIMLDSQNYESKVSSAICRSIGGRMFGGHDPSGHVFLLIHSSLYLLFETFPLFEWNSFISSYNRTAVIVFSRNSFQTKVANVLNFATHHPIILAWSLILLWWWMLLMTSIYFHSIAEKFVGLIWGYLGVMLIYVLPRLLQST